MGNDDIQFYIGVKALIENPEGKVLLLKAVPHKPGQNFAPYWDLPGGKMQDPGVKETLVREVEEETGIKGIKVGQLYAAVTANFRINDGKDNLLFLIYRCSTDGGAEIRLSKEHSEYKWVPIEEARQHLSFMLPKEFLDELR
ncbi:MAG: NUDIX domain-containing protein [Candidatus Micrarchaeota archaeon]|nr:NUDIX domain-containing protein [Candidatus Micrarchaeota archaeon]